MRHCRHTAQPQTVMCRLGRVAFVVLVLASVAAHAGGLVTYAVAQATALTQAQADARAAYDKALREFKAILSERRAQIDGKQKLPDRPGQALYLARLQVISTYKDLTDAVPARIGRGNKFGVPPAYFDAAIEPLIDEYAAVFKVMQAPPAGAQESKTPFKDVADLGRAIARARGLDAATVDAAGRISLGVFFAETNGNQNIGNARSNTYKGSMQTGVAEDRKGRAAWAALKPRIAALDPAVAARDEAETARVGNSDQRFNHWTAVRNGLMNAHADLFARIPAITKMLPDPIDQMKLFQLIQIIPSPNSIRARLGQLRGLSDFGPEDHGIPAQQLHLHLRQGGPGEDVGDLSRNSRRDVAVHREVRARPGKVRGDQSAGEGPGAITGPVLLRLQHDVHEHHAAATIAMSRALWSVLAVS